MPTNPISTYRRQIERELAQGNATEHTHRPALKSLIESLSPGITATNEPKRVQCGAPDFELSEKTGHGPVKLGYIECKDVGKPLNEIESSEQMRRYLPALQNLILTDYVEFRWYVNGERRLSAQLARLTTNGRLISQDGGPNAVSDLLGGFLSQSPESISDPKTLALRMAQLTRFIRGMIVTDFERESASATLRDLHDAFEAALIPDLPIPQFADMFAQTLAYGLFAARCNHTGPSGSFKRLGAASEIPKTNPFLRQLFDTITGTALDDEPFVGFVDDLAQLLADTDIGAVLADFGKRTARQDPVVHFYETFLAAYDPKLREARGVYYTPEPVVSYIVRSVDSLLKTRFGCSGGFADVCKTEYERETEGGSTSKKTKATSHRVLVLDPACGTGTFLYAVIDLIRDQFVRQGNAGMWSGYVRNHLLPRIFGFELLMAPYAVAHFKLGMQLAGHDLTPEQRRKWAYDFGSDERLGVFLTNSLEEAEGRVQTLPGPWRVITEEAKAGSKVKKELPILAVIGNPPYSGHSANRSYIDRVVSPGESYQVVSGGPLRSQRSVRAKIARRELRIREKTFIGQLLDDYYFVDDQPLGERNPKWLQNDYVKFIRWGQWRIENTGAGVLAFITDHSYLDSPTFRGMRRNLMRAFSEIYILDLHGNSKKEGKCPDGSKDMNVFDIVEGVAIGIFVKSSQGSGMARVWHADLWGVRETDNKLGGKYPWLFEHDLATTAWQEINPRSPFYLFKPREDSLAMEYDRGWKISDAMPINNMGITTGIDSFATDFSSGELKKRVSELASKESDNELRQMYGLEDTSSFALSAARKWAKSPNSTSFILPISYRCFDSRFVIYSSSVLARSREDICNHLVAGSNRALVTFRAIRKLPWNHVLLSETIATKEYLSTLDNCYLFPLYLCPARNKTGQEALEFDTSNRVTDKDARRPNLAPEFIAEIETRLRLSFVANGICDAQTTFGAEDVFNYIYAIFHSPTYRIRYAELLKGDYPRVPLTSDVTLFRSLCKLGADLVALHFLESPNLQPIARFPVKGQNQVAKGFPKYVPAGAAEPGTGKRTESGRVYINKGDPRDGKEAQYFEGVPPEVWEFYIGGYQVCEKWLKDRRGRTLGYDDLEHYCKVVTALQETIRLMSEIDAAIPKWPIA